MIGDRKRLAVISASDADFGIAPLVQSAIVARVLSRKKRSLGTVDSLAVIEELESHAGHIPIFPNRFVHRIEVTAVHGCQGLATWIVQRRDEIEVGKGKLVLRQHQIFFRIEDRRWARSG